MDNGGRTEPVDTVEGDWVEVPGPKRRCRREAKVKDQGDQTKGETLTKRRSLTSRSDKRYWTISPSYTGGIDPLAGALDRVRVGRGNRIEHSLGDRGTGPRLRTGDK